MTNNLITVLPVSNLYKKTLDERVNWRQSFLLFITVGALTKRVKKLQAIPLTLKKANEKSGTPGVRFLTPFRVPDNLTYEKRFATS